MGSRMVSAKGGKKCVSALSLDLSEAFDAINHERLLAKLKAYGLSLNAVKLLRNYLNNKKQHVQINPIRTRGGDHMVPLCILLLITFY